MNIFSRIRIPKLGRNNFDLSFENKLTCQMGKLVPIVVQEVLPGDRFQMSSNILVRFNPLVAPMMHRVDVYTHYFFVPNRLVWSEWEDFITGGEDGLATPEKPYFTYRDLLLYAIQGPASDNYQNYKNVGYGSLLDFIGIPLGFSKQELREKFPDGNVISTSDEEWLDTKVDVLALRAYQLIYNEYYRNQNTQSEIDINMLSGEQDSLDLGNLCILRDRNWGLDYFTSALPFSQRGPEQLVPVFGSAPNAIGYTSNSASKVIPIDPSLTPLPTDSVVGAGTDGQLNAGRVYDNGQSFIDVPSTTRVGVDNSDNLSIENASISIRDLRRAESIQEFLELSARAGSRYIEQIKAHFGVFSSDARLQRPEYLGGGKQIVQISSVDQTSATDVAGSTTPLGSYAGKAVSGGTTNSFRTKEFEEHGFIIGIMSVLPKTGYHQGLNRKFSRFDKLEYFWDKFQDLGDQEIKEKEIFVAQNTTSNQVPERGFGYTPRYSEYKINADEVHGDFKGNMDFWHLNRKFASPPRLNSQFSSTSNSIRQDIFAVQTDADGEAIPNMYVDIYNNIKARRPIHYYDNPQL